MLDGRIRLREEDVPRLGVVFWIYVATMMVPGQVTLIPLSGIMRELGLLNTRIALALPVVNAFGVFLIRQFMKGIPDDLLDAARIDGASDFRIFVRIILPLVKPRSEEHTSELQSRGHLVCRLLLEKKKERL